MNRKPYPQYKDSGVQWLGQVPEHWELKRIKHLGSIRYGLGEPPSDDPDGIPFIRATDINFGKVDLSSVKRVDPNDVPWGRRPTLEQDEILVVRSGAYTGDSSIVTGDVAGCIAGYDMVLTATQAHPRFLAWVLLSKYLLESQIYLARLRAAQPHLNAEELGGFTVLTPRFSEQISIADFLDEQTGKIDRLIGKKRALIARLKEKRTALISRTVTHGLPPDAAREFGLDPHTRFKDSGIDWLGEVPEGWEVKKFSRSIQIANGQVNPQNEPYASMLLVGPEHIESGTGRLLDVTTAEEQAAISGKYFCNEGDVIYSKIRPELRKVAIASIDCLCSADMYPIRWRHLEDSSYIFWMLLSDQFSTWATLESARVAMPKINRDSIGELQVPCPAQTEQSAITNYLNRETAKLDRLTEKVEAAIIRLQEYRTALITATVTGKIDVREQAA
ncbi:MAG: restriction endonuclease subunit S [Magnetococcales bacterium]|nr:restriction endonuclease subunit S [Magnetococcales bacterium]